LYQRLFECNSIRKNMISSLICNIVESDSDTLRFSDEINAEASLDLSFIIVHLDQHDVEISTHRTASSKRHRSRQRRWHRARAGRHDDDKRETKGRRHPPGYIPDALWPAKPRPRTSHPRGFPSCLHPPACAFFPFFSFLIRQHLLNLGLHWRHIVYLWFICQNIISGICGQVVKV